MTCPTLFVHKIMAVNYIEAEEATVLLLQLSGKKINSVSKNNF